LVLSEKTGELLEALRVEGQLVERGQRALEEGARASADPPENG
jgi:hypothetical protein